ncbi:hypothetical protein DFQ28_004945 [Apophysomyces sp. BC1034]|nr:hypothetical protein DFQ29_000319 [Apophysomyces sp. BC1021]KAG0188369.1 hypothetical protein DFQ28_004945 [Apophysomyces sp. BC1034]
MFLKFDGGYTTGNVYITEGDSVCVVVLLGPIPATSVVKAEEHLGPADSIVMTALGTTTKVPIRLQQHPRQSNAYFASVQFSHAGTYVLQSLNEYRSYFWESPIFHSYRPHRFMSENKLLVKPGSRIALDECSARQEVKGSWINKTDYQEAYPLDYYGMFAEAQEDHVENNRFFVPDGCRMPLISIGQAAQCLDQRTIHVWGDANVRRNLKAFSSGNRWCKDITDDCVCNDDTETTVDSYPWAIDPTVPLTINTTWKTDTTFYFNTVGSITLKDRREEISKAAAVLPQADIVLLSVGNDDIPLSRISPTEFAQAFVDLLMHLMELYPHQMMIVRTPQYFCCDPLHFTSWNSGRSAAFTNAVRNTVSQLGSRVWLWDVHALGMPDHMCTRAGTSYSSRNVVQIENLLLWNLVCSARQ